MSGSNHQENHSEAKKSEIPVLYWEDRTPSALIHTIRIIMLDESTAFSTDQTQVKKKKFKAQIPDYIPTEA